MNQDTLLKAVVGGLFAICFGLLAWQLRMTVNLSTQVELLRYQVQQLQCDSEDDAKQNETIRKHWKLHGWARDEINDLRHKQGMDSSRWPNLE